MTDNTYNGKLLGPKFNFAIDTPKHAASKAVLVISAVLNNPFPSLGNQKKNFWLIISQIIINKITFKNFTFIASFYRNSFKLE